MTSLYDPKKPTPVDADGKSLMQPTCKEWLVRGHGNLASAVKKEDLEAIKAAFNELATIQTCHERNLHLPCAEACAAACKMGPELFADFSPARR